MQVNPGFDSHHLLAGSFRLPVPNDPKADEYVDIYQRTHLVRESIRRLHGIAGVENAAMSSVVPLNGPVVPSGFRVEGVSDKETIHCSGSFCNARVLFDHGYATAARTHVYR